jgi:nitroimidazol reductase NimA-like FMN-containing flavoprotein (pyridoxamine 5'-phosphate oxidase superfamily)
VEYDIALSGEELARLLARETIAVVASVNPDGTPHAAPIWPILIGEDLYFETERLSRKAANLRVRPACCLVVGLGPWGPSAVLFGRAREVDDLELRARVREVTAIRYYGTVAHPGFVTIERQYERFGGSSVFRVELLRIASWDYRKMPVEEWILPDMPP